MQYFKNPRFEDLQSFLYNEQIELDVSQCVTAILTKVKEQGDNALIEYTKQFDNVDLSGQSLKIAPTQLKNAFDSLSPEFLESLNEAKKCIVRYHEHQKRPNWQYEIGYDSYIRELTIPVQRAGIYIPAGTAPLISTVLMTVLPAKVAGVSEIIVVTPPQPDGSVNEGILAACALCGVSSVYRIGGAQSIAALAYGTSSIPRVDCIVGPGNKYVTEAKRQLYGIVGIDMIAGPTEILILADENTNPTYAAIDMLSQIEHGKDSKALCICTNSDFLNRLQKEIKVQAESLSRQDILSISLDRGIALIEVPDTKTMISLANEISSEHLEIMTRRPSEIAEKIQNAGVVFLGEYTPEAVGDYVAGPSHVLPTGGKARFFEGLSIYHFVKKVSHIFYTKNKLRSMAHAISDIALAEGLDAHCQSVLKRCEEK
ncbi:histidinol dehydrogenase [bacterium]|nr:histidinol dehydrogenase [bacterium]